MLYMLSHCWTFVITPILLQAHQILISKKVSFLLFSFLTSLGIVACSSFRKCVLLLLHLMRIFCALHTFIKQFLFEKKSVHYQKVQVILWGSSLPQTWRTDKQWWETELVNYNIGRWVWSWANRVYSLDYCSHPAGPKLSPLGLLRRQSHSLWVQSCRRQHSRMD